MSNAQGLFDGYRMRSTARLQKQCELGLLEIPYVPPGGETQQFQVGTQVQAAGTGALIKGITLTILDAWEENGYWRYLCQTPTGGKTVERQKDLMEIA